MVRENMKNRNKYDQDWKEMADKFNKYKGKTKYYINE